MKNSIYIILLLFANQLYAFTPEYAYVVEFADKKGSAYSISQPNQFLSERAIERRQKQGIAITEQDLPVNKNYIDSISKYEARYHQSSRWMNSAVYYTSDENFPEIVKNVSFVKNTILVHDNRYFSLKSAGRDKLSLHAESPNNIDYGNSSNQITMCMADSLHNAGYRGEGMIVAVIDGGFIGTDTITCFKHLYNENKILGTYDFVENREYVYVEGTHGTYVLSTIAANEAGVIYGTAPNAKFYLLRSEDGSSESPIECENWIAAAEYADSAGVDVVNTSLGYGNMDAPYLSYDYSTMNGVTNRISIASDIAFAKGMIMVNSAGNEGEYKISAPADAYNTLTIGAVNSEGVMTSFSSRGPSYDGRVKPDICAQGSGVTLVNEFGAIVKASGTSFSSPLIAGMVACLWQSNPNKTNKQIITAIQKSASHYHSPTDSLGYGIPNFKSAMVLLEDFTNTISIGKTFPNPFSSHINVFFNKEVDENIEVELFSTSGNRVCYRTYLLNGDYLKIDNLGAFSSGIYILKIKTSKETIIEKMIKE